MFNSDHQAPSTLPALDLKRRLRLRPRSPDADGCVEKEGAKKLLHEVRDLAEPRER